MTKFNVKKAAAGTAMTGAMGLGLLGVGAGVSQADPTPAPPVPTIPGTTVPATPAVNTWNPSMPPGQNPFGAPGQVMKMQTLNVNGVEVPNPFYGVPPGHWNDPAYLKTDVLTWQPPGYPEVTTPLKVVWNGSQWGVNVDANTFVAFPIRLPAPDA